MTEIKNTISEYFNNEKGKVIYSKSLNKLNKNNFNAETFYEKIKTIRLKVIIWVLFVSGTIFTLTIIWSVFIAKSQQNDNELTILITFMLSIATTCLGVIIGSKIDD